MLLHLREVDFQEILKINEKSGLSEEGSDARDPVLGHFRRRFLKYFYITIVGAKIVPRKGACNSELNFAPKAQNLRCLGALIKKKQNTAKRP